jgi:hypothetical protein
VLEKKLSTCLSRSSTFYPFWTYPIVVFPLKPFLSSSTLYSFVVTCGFQLWFTPACLGLKGFVVVVLMLIYHPWGTKFASFFTLKDEFETQPFSRLEYILVTIYYERTQCYPKR